MTKFEFLADLYNGLSALPEQDIEEQLNYYSEIIDDRIEDGLSEEEAIAQIGKPEQIITQILADMPISKLIKTKRRLSAGEITLLAIGSPLWFPLLIAASAVIFALYISLWAVIVSLWAVFSSCAASGFGALIAGSIFLFNGSGASGLFTIGAGFICLGLSVFLFLGCKAITKATVVLTKKIILRVKKSLARKEKGV